MSVLTRSWTATVIGPQRSSRWRKELEPFFFKIWHGKESLLKMTAWWCAKHITHITPQSEHLYIRPEHIRATTSRAMRPHYLMRPPAASWENCKVPWVCLRACWVSQTCPNPRGLNIAPPWEVTYFRLRSALKEFNLLIDWDGSWIPKRPSD